MMGVETIFDQQVRSFLVACSMLSSIIGTHRLHEAANDKSSYIFDNNEVEHAIRKVYKAYDNIDVNNLDNIWNADVISNLISLIENAQSKISKAVLFVHGMDILNRDDILEALSFESNSMEDLKEELNDRLDFLE